MIPVVIFVYNRVDHVRGLFSSLQECDGIEQTEIFVFSDAPVLHKSRKEVACVREKVRKISESFCCKKFNIIEAKQHKGLANSVIDGVTEIIEKYKMAIVLEDDLVVSSDFLVYMNKALTYYRHDKRIWAISGFTEPYDSLKSYPYDVYLSKRAESWGWGTWINRWKAVDWKVKDYFLFKYNRISRKKFNQGGSFLANMLDDYMSGKNDSWAVRWCYAQYRHKTYSIYPRDTHVLNVGFDNRGTHCRGEKIRQGELYKEDREYRFVFPPFSEQIAYEIEHYYEIEK